MQDPCPGARGNLVGAVEVLDTKAELHACRRGAFGLREREVEVRAIAPGGLGVATTGPAIIDPVVTRVELDTEHVPIERGGPFHIRDFEDHGDESTRVGHHTPPGSDGRYVTFPELSTAREHAGVVQDDVGRVVASSFATEGFAVVRSVVPTAAVDDLSRCVEDAVIAYRAASPAARPDSDSLGEYARARPERNPGIDPEGLVDEPYILGNLAARGTGFRRFLACAELWEIAALCLGVPVHHVVYHSAQVLRKPAHVGPAVSWHRDISNQYIATDGPRFVRLLVPLHPMGVRNGGTAVAPRSHLVDTAGTMTHDGLLDDVVGAQCPDLAPGDLLALHANMLHGSAPNRSDAHRDLFAAQFGDKDAPLTHRAVAEHLSMCGRPSFATGD